jgi:hypothetical protein
MPRGTRRNKRYPVKFPGGKVCFTNKKTKVKKCYRSRRTPGKVGLLCFRKRKDGLYYKVNCPKKYTRKGDIKIKKEK